MPGSSPWTGSTGAGRSDTSFLRSPAAATFEAFSSHPPPRCRRRDCHSVRRSGGRPRRAACAAAAPCPCQTTGQHQHRPGPAHPQRGHCHQAHVEAGVPHTAQTPTFLLFKGPEEVFLGCRRGTQGSPSPSCGGLSLHAEQARHASSKLPGIGSKERPSPSGNPRGAHQHCREPTPTTPEGREHGARGQEKGLCRRQAESPHCHGTALACHNIQQGSSSHVGYKMGWGRVPSTPHGHWVPMSSSCAG